MWQKSINRRRGHYVSRWSVRRPSVNICTPTRWTDFSKKNLPQIFFTWMVKRHSRSEIKCQGPNFNSYSYSLEVAISCVQKYVHCAMACLKMSSPHLPTFLEPDGIRLNRYYVKNVRVTSESCCMSSAVLYVIHVRNEASEELAFFSSVTMNEFSETFWWQLYTETQKCQHEQRTLCYHRNNHAFRRRWRHHFYHRYRQKKRHLPLKVCKNWNEHRRSDTNSKYYSKHDNHHESCNMWRPAFQHLPKASCSNNIRLLHELFTVGLIISWTNVLQVCTLEVPRSFHSSQHYCWLLSSFAVKFWNRVLVGR